MKIVIDKTKNDEVTIILNWKDKDYEEKWVMIEDGSLFCQESIEVQMCQN